MFDPVVDKIVDLIDSQLQKEKEVAGTNSIKVTAMFISQVVRCSLT